MKHSTCLQVFIFSILFLVALLQPEPVYAVRYACKPGSCAPCYQSCHAPPGIIWSGTQYTVTSGTYVIKNKCYGIDDIVLGVPCKCDDIIDPWGEGYNTCAEPDKERYFSNNVGDKLGWDPNYCGTQQTDINKAGINYWHSMADLSPSVCAGVTPGPTDTPTPTPSPTSTPVLPGTIRVRAVILDPGMSCQQMAGGTTLVGAELNLASGGPLVSRITQGEYFVWSAIPVTDPTSQYGLESSVTPNNFSPADACFTSDGGTTWSTGTTTSLDPGETIEWHVGYSPPGPWVQTGGGDVYVHGNLRSLIPSGLTLPYSIFNRDGTGESPGVVNYAQESSDPDFSFAIGNNIIPEFVSSEGWLVKDNQTPSEAMDFYEYFWRAFGSPVASSVTGVNDPSSGVYVSAGDLHATGAWNISGGQIVTIFVDGTFFVDSPIAVAQGGFLGVVAKNGISVKPLVSGSSNNETPIVEGVYITNGTFATGVSTGSEKKLVGAGMFIANSFLLGRTLDADNVNYPAELFVYRPDFLVTMPYDMKETLLRWQEVAP